MRDVAEEAGVSITMVSRVLRNSGSFGEATKSVVLKAAEKLDYRPDAIARSLRTKQTKNLTSLYVKRYMIHRCEAVEILRKISNLNHHIAFQLSFTLIM